MNELRDRDLARIRRAAARTRLRLRLGRALDALHPSLLAALGLMAGAFAAHRAFPELLSAQRATTIVAILPALVVASALVAFASPARNPPLAGAIALERHHGLRGRLTAALAFAGLAPRHRTALMELAIDDACAHADRLAPGRAAPLRAPRGLPLAGAVALATVATARLQSVSPIPAPSPPSVVEAAGAVTLEADDRIVLDGLGCASPRPDERPDAGTVRFVQYRTVAEDHLEQDRIPDGYRFYVRRYFALIRPRD